MSLSRHFYSLDEVQAALIFSASRNNQKETLFWCQELLSSGLVAETISALFESWLFHTGGFRLQWLLDSWQTLASDELTESDILLAAYRLSNINYTRRDNSLWNILVITGCEPDKQPDRVTPKTPIGATDTFEGIDLYFIRAVYQGKAHSAWWATQFMSVNRVWEILRWFAENVYTKYTEKYLGCLRALEGYEALLGFRNDEYDIIIRCVAVLSFCISSSARDESFKPQVSELGGDELEFLKEHKALEGRKGARMFSVPVLCLYGITERGRSQWSQHNFAKLNNVEKYMRGCTFWDEAVAEFVEDDSGDEIKWSSDDAYETFYNRYFPDDIPDEWSRSEKLKSHGDGVLGPTEKLSLVKYTRTHFGKLCHLAWNTREIVFKQLEKLSERCNCDCNIVSAVGGFKFSVERPIQEGIKLEPVHKRRILSSSSSS